MSRYRPFRNLSVTVIFAVFVLSAVILGTAAFFSAEVFRIIFVITAFLLVIFLFLFSASFLLLNRLLRQKEDTSRQNPGPVDSFLISAALRLYMPFLMTVSGIFNYKKDEIRRIFIKANNEYVLSFNKKIPPERLLLLLPHCLQHSECVYRMRNGLNECRQCCRCTLGRIKDLVAKSGVNAVLATGGTSARKAVRDLNPALVVAVACERDLSSGIMDIMEIPVYGIINSRPNGPCTDTLVDTGELETVIRHFTEEKS